MTKASDYRAKAADCERQAAQADDPAVKTHYQKLADAWQVLAEQAERDEPKPSNPSSGGKGKAGHAQ